MNHTSFAVTVFLVIVGILLFGLWSNVYVYVYAQDSSLPSSPPSASTTQPSSPSPAESDGSSTMLSTEQIATICDPNNPESKLNPVNTTESKICGIPKTWHPSNSSIATTATTPEQTTITKPTASTMAAATPKQHQQIATTNNNKTVSRLTDTKVAATAPVGN